MPKKVYDAVVSFAFNVGTEAMPAAPRWLRCSISSSGQRRAASCRAGLYVKGVFNQGLDYRRAREMARCLKGAGYDPHSVCDTGCCTDGAGLAVMAAQ